MCKKLSWITFLRYVAVQPQDQTSLSSKDFKFSTLQLFKARLRHYRACYCLRNRILVVSRYSSPLAMSAAQVPMCAKTAHRKLTDKRLHYVRTLMERRCRMSALSAYTTRPAKDICFMKVMLFHDQLRMNPSEVARIAQILRRLAFGDFTLITTKWNILSQLNFCLLRLVVVAINQAENAS